MRYIGEDGQYHQVLIELSDADGRELRRIIEEQKEKRMDYSKLFSKQEANAKSRP
jgi:hypothetical protein